MEDYQIIQGDCLEQMAKLETNSIDAVVTDPPYGIRFMGNKWDYNVPSVEIWKQALRVLKPGGHLLCFAGTRTHHRMACNIEDAGFDIRDMIAWVYGSGFPKSHNISKAIDKAIGAKRKSTGPVVYGDGHVQNHAGGKQGYHAWAGKGVHEGTAPATEFAKKWDGWGTALKPAFEPITVARKPFKGTVANNVLEHGTGGINIDGCRVEYQDSEDKATATPQGKCTSKPGALAGKMQHSGERIMYDRPEQCGRWPSNLIHDGDEEVVKLFPNTKSGKGKRLSSTFFYCAKCSKKDRNEGLEDFEKKQTTGGGGLTAKTKEDGTLETASAGGKYGSIKGYQQNTHPTVKPTELMRYLCRLVTPPGGLVLDPFMGSGSTGKACVMEGFRFTGCELDPLYCAIAERRIIKAIQERTNGKI